MFHFVSFSPSYRVIADLARSLSRWTHQRIMAHIDSGKKEGATVHLGGERHGTEGFFIQPTIFTDVTAEMKIVKEEIFGPVVAVAKFKDQDELLKLANDSFYGLAASVFSSDITKAITTANALEAGTVWINMANIPEKNMPFGGYKRVSTFVELRCHGIERSDHFLLYRIWNGQGSRRRSCLWIHRDQGHPYQPHRLASILSN